MLYGCRDAGRALAFAAAVAALALAPVAARAQQPTAPAPAAFDTSLFAGLQYTSLGPQRGGRSIAAAGSAARPNEYYFGATGGGLWKTTDGGATWKPVTDGQIQSSSVGAVAVCEPNPDVVYIGTGERELRGNVLSGDGIYKSADAGKTWKHVGLANGRNISEIRVDPKNCDRAFAAVFGHYGEPNPERGIFRTTDGGQTWKKVLFRDANTAGVAVDIDAKNPDIVFAGLWEAWRKPWGMSSGGKGSGLFRSTDGGETWTELTHNAGLIPQGMIVGKVDVSVSPADDSRVYAILEADSGGVFVSDDGGNTWKRTNDERKLRQRAFYYTHVIADPLNKDVVYSLNTGVYKSTDGGKKFDARIRVPHGDNHDLWIAPNDPDRMIEANDGGANVSVNGGKTWTEEDFPTAQFYRLALDYHQPYWLCGAQQDNSTACVPSKDWRFLSANRDGFFLAVGGGESGYIAPDPKNPSVYYAGSYGGDLTRFDWDTGEYRPINVWPDNPMGYSAVDIQERFQWTYPIVFSPADPNVLYATSQHVFRTTNEGQSWERISPDLTRHAPETMGPSGGPITKDQTGVETYATIFALAPSPHDVNTIWAGSDDGVVNVTRDAGKTWTNVTPKGMPEFVKITTIEVSPHQAGKAYMTGTRRLLGDFAPYIYRTSDYGKSWTKISAGIPPDEIARSIREDPVRPGLLYLGTERGVWVSFDGGAHWQRFSRNLPVAQVADLQVRDNDLALATHGRGFWIMYDVSPLRQLDARIAQADVHLFQPSPAIRSVDRGVNVYYSLKQPAKSVKLDFLDASGKVLRTFEGAPKPDSAKADSAGNEEEEFFGPRQSDKAPDEAGLNHFVWDLRLSGFTSFPQMIFWAARNAGPTIVPGKYQVRLTADGRTQTQPFEVKIDPRLQGKVTVADLQQRFDLATKIRDAVSKANDAVLLIRGVNDQIDDRLKSSRDAGIERKGTQVRDSLKRVEEDIYQTKNRSNQDPLNYPIMLNNKLAALLGTVEQAEAKPTAQMSTVYEMLSKDLDAELGKMNGILNTQLPELNDLLEKAGLPTVKKEPQKTDKKEAKTS